jgi:hypothetical protein
VTLPIGERFIAAIAVEGFPSESWPFMTEVHERVPVPHRFSSRFIPQDQHDGGAEHPVKPGDVIACPAGGPETAHQLVKTGETELRYLAVSTMLAPEVCEYPDSGKFSVISGSAPGGDKAMRSIWHLACGPGRGLPRLLGRRGVDSAANHATDA